jgi:hypothetical protein
MNAKKPRTTFSQDYIVARIEARVASLRGRVKEAGKTIEKLREREVEKRREYLMQMCTEADTWASRLDELNSETEPSELLELSEQFSAWASKAREKPGLDYHSRIQLEELVRENDRFESELDLLEHAYAYLKESTIEEYSITSLRSLGLLDIVKFALTPEAEQARQARRSGRQR